MRERIFGAVGIWLAVGAVTLAVMASIGATTAAAAPTWHYCDTTTPAKTGNYANSTCSEASEPGKGKFELFEGIGKGKGFKGSGGKMIWHMVIPGKGDFQTECASFKATGNVATPGRVVDVHLTLLKCKVLGGPCKTEGGPKETIESEALAGQLGYLNKAHTAAGVSLSNEASPGTGLIAHFECEGLAQERWKGAIIASVTPFGVVSKSENWTWTVGPFLGELSPGYTPLTNPPSFEEGEEPVGVLLTELNGPETGGEWAPEGGLPSGWEASLANTGEALEIK
jgi:hypothetical protein